MSSTFILNANHPGRAGVLAALIAFLSQLPLVKSWRITIELYRKARTDPQNHALWGVAYPPLMEFIGLRGEQDRQELHRAMCGDYFGWVDFPGGVRKPKRTTTTDETGRRNVLPWNEFADFYAHVQQQGAQLGVFIPDPDPFHDEAKAA